MPALAEELVARGLDLWLEIEDEAESDETLELLMRWLAGEQLTERADEHELRLNTAEDALELFSDNVPSLHRFHAQAVLMLPTGHERRDAAEAIAELWDHLEATREDTEETIRTIAALLDAGAGDEALLDEGDELIAEADPGGIDVFRLAAVGYTASRHIEVRDAGDEAEAARWAARHGAYLDADEGEGLPALAGRAGQHDMAGEWDEAADLYRTVVEGSDLGEWSVQQMAVREGELRLMLGQLDRAATALEAVLVHAEARYLTAVTEADVTDAGTRLYRIADALATTDARRGDWDGVLRALDRPRGLRGRYQAALRADAAGRELLAVERELDVALRAATADEEVDGVSAGARLLERYRQVRPRLDPSRLETPAVADVAAALGDGECLCILGHHFMGTVGVFVAPRDTRRPSGRLLLEDVGTREWLELFAGDTGGEWLQMLIEPGGGVDPEPSLSELLEGIDDVLGDWLRQQLDDEDAARLTLVPGATLHLVPWAALPSLEGIDVVIAASVSEAVRARRTRPESAPRSALVVANPTLDLRVSAAACRPIADRLDAANYAVTELAAVGATEPALLAAAPGATILHFAGHGRGELSHSGLEVHPDEALDGDPFVAWSAEAVGWRQPPADEEDDEPPWHDLLADVPGVGRLHERRWTRVNRLDRRLDRPGSTLVATYGGDRLLRLAELWSTSDILLADPLEGCRLAVLVACASGAGIGRFDEAQAGLPVGLQLAGIDSVIATRWEVDEGFAALWAERFYAGLAEAGATADLAALVRATCEELRDMEAGEARERLLALADAAADPFAAMALEAYAHRLPDPPFAAPSQWAAFFLTGRPTLELAA